MDVEYLGAAAGLIGGVAGLVALAYTIYRFRTEDRQANNFEAMVKSHNALVRALKEDIDTLRAEVSVLRTEVERRGRVDALAIQQRERELAQRKTEHAWQMVTDAARGLGWLSEHGVDEDDEDY